MNKSSGKLILGLETGIDGGGAALVKDGRLISAAKGTGNLSKSEDLLLLIEDLLKKNGLSRKQIDSIAISVSPGSATGLRIGLATAAGLSDALRIKVFKISVLEALVRATPAKKCVISALYTEKAGIYFCKYRLIEDIWKTETEIINIRDPRGLAEIFSEATDKFVIDRNLALKIEEISDFRKASEAVDIHVVEGSLAEIIGYALYRENASDNEQGIHNIQAD